MRSSEARFYFALPRLIAKLLGANSSRSDANWLETNVVGAAIHLIVFAFFAQLLLAGSPAWLQLLLLPPLILLVWLFWIVFFYLTSLLIKGMRATGLFRHLATVRIQSVLVCATATVFAWELRPLGYVWVAAVALNLIAAALLHADRSAAG
jgi:hypothetical protein